MVLLVLVLCATDSQAPPSRRARDVVPHLAQISPGDNFSRVIELLGEPDYVENSGYEDRVVSGRIVATPVEQNYFRLDDKTEVIVAVTNRSVHSIVVQPPDQESRTLF